MYEQCGYDGNAGKQGFYPVMKRANPLSKHLFGILFALILLAQISFVIYKADYTGITYDESYTSLNFGKDIHTALTCYENPNNNHVLNSIFICLAYKSFRWYEHYPRIHSVMFAVLFSCSTAYIVHKTIRHATVKLALLGLVLFNWFVFDLSFLARGYSIALGAVYAGIAVLLGLLKRKISYNCRWLPVTVIVLVNFLAFGSMISSLFILLGINAVFILLYSHCLFKDPPNRRNPLVLNLSFIPLLSGASLFLLYKNIYKDIFAARDSFGTMSFYSHIKQLLVDSMLKQDNHIVFIAYCLFVFAVTLAFFFAMCRSCKKIKNDGWRNWPCSDASGNFVLLTTAAAILAMFIHRVVLGMSLGYMRNGVFLVPLLLISSGILVDRLCYNLKSGSLAKSALRNSFLAISTILILLNLPSAYSVLTRNWKLQSVSGPLLRWLSNANPDKTWKIDLSTESQELYGPLKYYSTLSGYKFEIVSGPACDVAIRRKKEKHPEGTYLNQNYFINFDCYVILNPERLNDINQQLHPFTSSVDEKR